MPPDDPSTVPRPLYSGWSSSLREAAQAFWHWHLDLADAVSADTFDAKTDAFFEAEQQRAQAGEPMRLVREPVWDAAYAACERHRLARDLLAAQVDGVRRLQGRVRFADTPDLDGFLETWAVPLGRLLAGLLGLDRKWDRVYIDELARGFFFVGRLMALPDDLENDRLFIPKADVEQTGVTLDQLRQGIIDENMRKLLWKQSIRARDAMGQGQGLIRDLPLRYRLLLKRWWIGALEMLKEIERRDYDVWSEPLELSWMRRTQVNLLTVFGKAATRSR